MKISNFKEIICVLNEHTDVRDIISQIVAAKKEEDPFYVCDIDDIIQKYRLWSATMPRITPHYAVKCNDHPIVLKVLAALGTGFDCASKSEIDKVLSVGVDPSRIIYAHTTKPPSHISYATKLNINLMTFDSEPELQKIKALSPDARTVIRIKQDSETAYCTLGVKYGCDPKTEAATLLETAHNLGINVVGVSFHVGSGCQDPTAYRTAIAAARRVFDAGATIGYKFDLLDIGGGYPGECDDSIRKYANIINLAIDEYFPNRSVKIIAEPGTYFVGSAFTLACNVHSARKVVKNDPMSGKVVTHYMYYVNDGVFGSFNCVISYNIFKTPQPLKNYSDSEKHLSTVWGPTCDSMDKIIGNVMLPELKLGDWLIFEDMGAYTLPLCTPFNGFGAPRVYSIIDKNNWMLLRTKSPLQEEDFTYNSALEADHDIKGEQHYSFPETIYLC